MKQKQMKAMIFAAGLGTRLKAITKDKPKALVEVAGVTLLEHAINYLKKYGITDVCVNVHHFPDQIISFLKERGDFGINISLSDERDELLDTGGGLKKAQHFLSGEQPILLYNVDIFTDLDLNKLATYHCENETLATVVVRDRQTQRYLLFDKNNNLSGWENIKTGEQKKSRLDAFDSSKKYAFSGIHIIQPELFNLITETGNFSIIDLYLRLAKQHTIKAYIDESENWFDLGKAEQLNEIESKIQKLKS